MEVAVRPHLVEALEDRWPPLGLRRQDLAPGREVARFGLSDTWMIVPDTEPSGDAPPPIAWDLLESELGLFTVKRLERLVPVLKPGGHGAADCRRDDVMVSFRRPRTIQDVRQLSAGVHGCGIGSVTHRVHKPRAKGSAELPLWVRRTRSGPQFSGGLRSRAS